MSIQDILTDITNNTTRINAEKSRTTMGQSEMGSDAFMRLLMAQLQNQDPLNPTDSSQFMQQQASLTTVSELQKLNTNMTSSNSVMQASSLIGKEVTMVDPNDAEKTITGKVTEAVFSSTGAGVVVNGKGYPLNLIMGVKEATTSSTTDSGSSNTNNSTN